MEPQVLGKGKDVSSLDAWPRQAEKLKDDILSSIDAVLASTGRELLNGSTALYPPIRDPSQQVWALVQQSLDQVQSIEPWRQWTRWLKLESPFIPSQAILSQNKYWSMIQSGLRSSSAEKQKLSLHLFRKSIFLCQGIATILLSFLESEKAIVKATVERFCKAYETIIIGRYLNQVKEALKVCPPNILTKQHGLGSASGSFELHHSWWIALFFAATSSKMNRRVAATVGTWVLEREIDMSTYDEHLGALLSRRLIPWAATGSLFQESIMRSGERVECIHGNLVSNFISTLLLACVDQASVTEYFQTLFTPLLEKEHDPRALAFILMGIDALPLTRWKSLPNVDASRLIDTGYSKRVYGKSPLNEELKRVCDYHFQSLRFMLSSTTSAPSMETDDAAVRGSTILSQGDSILANCLKIGFMRQTWIPHQDLVFLINTLTHQLGIADARPPTALEKNVLAAFKKIWELAKQAKAGIQCLQRLPGLFYCTLSLKLSKEDDQLCNFLASRLVDLYLMAETKISIWNPLAKALWQAYMTEPSLSSMLPIDKILLLFSKKPPTPSANQLLDFAIGQKFLHSKGLSAYPELADEGQGHAFMFDIANRLRIEDFALGVSIINSLMDSLLASTKKSHSHYAPLPTNALHMIFLLSEKCLVNPLDVAQYRKDLMHLLEFGMEPRIRFLLEFMIVSAYWRRLDEPGWSPDDLLDKIEEFHDDSTIPKQMVSLMKVAFNLSHHESIRASYFSRFMDMLPTLCSFDKLTVKREALWTFPQMMDLALRRQIQGTMENPVFVRLEAYIRSLRRFKNPPETRLLERYDPSLDRSLSMIFQGPYSLLEYQCPSVIYTAYFNTIEELERQLSSKFVEPPPKSIPIGRPMILPTAIPTIHEEETTKVSMDVPFQSKYLTPVNDFENTDASASKGDLILIASLIDSPWNLGGLTRAAEIYGCKEIHLPNLKVIKEGAFTSVAVSSEDHIDIVETTASDLASFCARKRDEGWTIVGVEQTDSSLILGEPETKLPAKAIIVMGTESTGMPPDILVECDMCVEIRQWGVTRSLNVQTAAATVLYEWRRQRGNDV